MVKCNPVWPFCTSSELTHLHFCNYANTEELLCSEIFKRPFLFL